MNDFDKKNGAFDSLQKIKVVLVGDQGVGKTCLLNRFVTNKFDLNTNSTIGVDFFLKPFNQNDVTYKFHFWDTAGQERFHSLIPSYIKNCQVAIMVYDISNLQSFKNLQNWYNIIFEEKQKDIILAVVGTKLDLPRAVETEDGLAFAKSHNAVFQECSAKTDQNVSTFFNYLCETVINTWALKELENKENDNSDESFERRDEKFSINHQNSNQTKCCK